MLQSSQFDGVAFDPFSFQKDGLASAEVDVGGPVTIDTFHMFAVV